MRRKTYGEKGRKGKYQCCYSLCLQLHQLSSTSHEPCSNFSPAWPNCVGSRVPPFLETDWIYFITALCLKLLFNGQYCSIWILFVVVILSNSLGLKCDWVGRAETQGRFILKGEWLIARRRSTLRHSESRTTA